MVEKRLGEDVFASWFGRVTIERASEESVVLAAPTRFIADYIRQHFLDDLLTAWPGRRVEIAVGMRTSPR